MSADIKYLNRDFASFKESLINFTKTYFPETNNDFSDASPATMMIEMCSYVGDVLSLYTDRNYQENFLEFAITKENIISLAYQLGYTPKVTSTATAELDVFQQLPAKVISGIASPDWSYALSISKEAKIKSVSNNGTTFITTDVVNFAFSSSVDPTTVSVYNINSSTSQPEYYLLKKKVKAIAGTIKSQDFTFGDARKFSSVQLNDSDVIQILDAVDNDGNKWYETPYLASSTVFEQIPNTQLNDPNLSSDKGTTPYLLKLKKVQRRFETRFDGSSKLNIKFGSGISNKPDEEIIPNTYNVGLGLVDSFSKLTTSFDPANFLMTKEYGLAPANTTLTFRYIAGGGVETNVPSGDITSVYEVEVDSSLINPSSLNQMLLQSVKKSVAFNNQLPASGGGSGDSVEDIRLKGMATFPTQLRCVNGLDYEVRCLSMPSNFGTIAKVKHVSGDGNNPLGLSLYVLSYNSDKKLTTASTTLKENLKTYISQYKMDGHGVSIKDALFVNIGINFDIICLPSYNSREILAECLRRVSDYFSIDKLTINQPLVLADIYSELLKVKGIQNVSRVEVVNKQGESNGYSKYGYDIYGATLNNIIYPPMDPTCWEVRYPLTDIKGRIVTI